MCNAQLASCISWDCLVAQQKLEESAPPTTFSKNFKLFCRKTKTKSVFIDVDKIWFKKKPSNQPCVWWTWYVCVCGDGVVGVVIVFIGQRIHFIIWYDWAPINESLYLHNIAHYFIELLRKLARHVVRTSKVLFSVLYRRFFRRRKWLHPVKLFLCRCALLLTQYNNWRNNWQAFPILCARNRNSMNE